jgi:DNA-binding transcriptional MerR regulator
MLAWLTLEPGRRFSVDAVSSYRISELARLAAVPASALLFFYEQAGLLLADGTGSGYRVPQAQRVQDVGIAFRDQQQGP